jgi:hypothetical protein
MRALQQHVNGASARTQSRRGGLALPPDAAAELDAI